MKKYLGTTLLIVVMCMTLLFSACGGGKPSGDKPEVSKAVITFEKAEYAVAVNKTEIVKVTVTDYTGVVTFSSTDTGVLSVRKIDNKSATISGKKAGTTTIKVEAGTVSKTCSVTVSAIDVLWINKTRLTIEDNAASTMPNTLTATYEAAIAGTQVSFVSADPSIVEIVGVENDTATLSGKMVGKTTIEVTVGSASQVCEVEVANYGIEYEIFNEQLWVKGEKEGMDIQGKLYIPEIAYYDGSNTTYQGRYLSVMGIREKSFQNCTGLTELYVGYNVKCISAHAFDGTKIAKLSFQMEESKQSQIRTIADYAFSKTLITEFIMPNTQDGYYFGPGIFKDCVNLEKVQLADNVPNLFAETFCGTKIKTIYFGGALTESLDKFGNVVDAIEAGTFSEGCTFENVYYQKELADWSGLMSFNKDTRVKAINTNNIYFGATGIGTGAKLN